MAAAPNPTVPLSPSFRAQLSPTSSLSRSPSFPIRAPLSSDDNVTDVSSDDGFHTASDPDDPAPALAAAMPLAHLTGDDEGDEVFEDGLSDVDGDGLGLPAVRVPAVDDDEDDVLADESEAEDGEVFDPEIESAGPGVSGAGTVKENGADSSQNRQPDSVTINSEFVEPETDRGIESLDNSKIEVGPLPELAAEGSDFVPAQEAESQPVIDNLKIEPVAPKPELATDSSDFSTVQKVESPPIVDNLKIEDTVPKPELAIEGIDVVPVPEAESPPIIDNLKIADVASVPEFAVEDRDSVPVQEVESQPDIDNLKIEPVEPLPELATESSDFVPVQEAESPPIIDNLKIEPVALSPELATESSDFVPVQEAESPPIVDNLKIEPVAPSPELATEGSDFVPVQEAESPPIVDNLKIEPVAPSPELATEGSDFVPVQESESPPIIDNLKIEPVAPSPELDAEGSDVLPVQEAESQPIIDNLKIKDVAPMPEFAIEDRDSVPVQEVELPPIVDNLKIEEDVAPVPEFAAEHRDSVPVQEVESPPIIDDLKIEDVTPVPEFAVEDRDSVPVQGVESPPIIDDLKIEDVAPVPEFAVEGSDSVPVPEVESPPIIDEETGSGERENEITGDSSMAMDDATPAVVSSETVENTDVGARKSAEDVANGASVQEMESPDILPEQSETKGTETENQQTGLKEEIASDACELSMDSDDLVSVVKVESRPDIVDETRGMETQTDTIEASSICEDVNSAGISGGDDLASVQKKESPAILAEKSGSGEKQREKVEASNVTDSGSENKIAADACDNGVDLVSVQEAELPLIADIAEEFECSETETGFTNTSSVERDVNSVAVSGEALTSEYVSGLEENSPPAASLSDVDDSVEMVPNSAEEQEHNSASEGPVRVAILESPETKRIIEQLEEGSSSTSAHSGFEGLLKYPNDTDGQALDSDEDAIDTDEEGDGNKLFDAAAFSALLKAASRDSPDGIVSYTSSDGASIFSIDRPAGLGSSMPALKPAPARTQPILRTPVERTIVSEPERIMDDEERKLHEKFELLRVKFLVLVQKLGYSAEDSMAAKVLYRLSLIEGIRVGRQSSLVFSLENAKKQALEYEVNERDDLDFSCTILVLGKTGVGKSATVNSIFGEEKSHSHAFEQATTSVKEIVGLVDGVKIRVIDTPGLEASGADQASNRKILSSIKKHIKRSPPDIVLYVDRMDNPSRNLNDFPLLQSISGTLGSSIWHNTVVALTHSASAPPDGPSGYPLSYDVLVDQRSRTIQHSIGQAARDMRLMSHVALVENHPSCRRNGRGERVLPNGLCWRTHLLLLCYSLKIISEANSLLKIQEPSPGKLFGLRFRSPPFAYFLASLLQSRSHPKLANDQGVDNGDSDVDLDDLIYADQEVEEDEYDELPPFKPLRKSQIAKLTKEQRSAYFDEYDYRVKLLQKKQWKEELRRSRESKKGNIRQDDLGYDDVPADYDQDNVPTIPVPLPDMALPPSFDCDYPVYLYRSLEPTSQLLTRPLLDPNAWDHDCGYNYVNLVQNLVIVGRFPAEISVQGKKEKKDFNIHLDSSLSAKHGENGSTLAGFDIQSIGKQLAYILRSDTKFKNLKKNKTTAGISITFLGETVATGLKLEDQLSISKRVSLGARAGAVRSQGDVAYKTNLEATLRDKDYPFGQLNHTLGCSLTRLRGDSTLELDLQSQLSVGRNSKMAFHVGLNNKRSGQITIRTSSSDHLQLALVGILPFAISLYRRIWPGDSMLY